MAQLSPSTTFHFDPELANLLGQSFEGAWQALRSEGSAYAEPHNADRTREQIALKLIELAGTGERRSERLVELALAELQLLPSDQTADVSEQS